MARHVCKAIPLEDVRRGLPSHGRLNRRRTEKSQSSCSAVLHYSITSSIVRRTRDSVLSDSARHPPAISVATSIAARGSHARVLKSRLDLSVCSGRSRPCRDRVPIAGEWFLSSAAAPALTGGCRSFRDGPVTHRSTQPLRRPDLRGRGQRGTASCVLNGSPSSRCPMSIERNSRGSGYRASGAKIIASPIDCAAGRQSGERQSL